MIPSRKKRRIVIALYHRNRLSLGENRVNLNHSAYHWGILIKPKLPDADGRVACNAYDATDMSVTDPVNHVDLNPNHDWFFRAQNQIDPNAQGRLIGCIIVGKLPKHLSDATVEEMLRDVALPVKDASPRESCVTWALEALSAFQREEWAWQFDTDEFKDWALNYGDQCMQNLGKENVCEYNGDSSLQ